MLVPKIDKLKKQSENDEKETLVIENFDEKMDFYSYGFLEDTKLRTKFVTRIEKIVRSSLEYRNYISFLKNELDLTRCVLLPEIDQKELKVSLEFHHYPFNLYEIVDAVLESYISKGQTNINPFLIAEEVTKLHYQNKIGLVPLSFTVHELAHDGLVFINLKYVYGNYKKFMSEYVINEKLQSSLATLEKMSTESIENDILKKHFIDLKIEDVTENNIKPIKVEVLKQA